MSPTFEEVAAVFQYDSMTGIVSRNGDESGYIMGAGYRLLSLRNRRIYAHRVAWLLMTGVWPTVEIDHANGDKSDNRWCNLRLATRQQNARNQSITSRNTSGYKGVSFHARVGRWRAVIETDQGHRHLGYFDTKEAASIAYREAATEHFGQFAKLQ